MGSPATAAEALMDHPTDLQSGSLVDPFADQPHEASPEWRDKLDSSRILRMRDLVEGTTRSYKRIGAEVGVSASTISRYVTAGSWRRPPGAAPAARIARQRDKVTERLWSLTAQHAKALKEQPLEQARRSLQPLASLTRALGGLDKHPSRMSETDEMDLDSPRPRRTINELRDELAAHLARIEKEEGEYWDRFDWFFRDGEGI
jgi:hypothetical protein